MSALSNGWIRTAPVRSANARASTRASSRYRPWKTTSAPYPRVAFSLGIGAPSGMNTVALIPSACAARATPCAWLPADAATTPRAFSSGERRDIRVYAPRILKEPARWRFSHLSFTGLPVRAESQRDSSMGVRRAIAVISSAARSMSSIDTCTTSLILPLARPLVELVGHAGLVGVADQPVVASGRRVGRRLLPCVVVVLLECLLGILTDPGLRREVLYDGVGSRRERDGDQRA